MTQGHNNLKRIVRRCKEEMRATFEIARVVSFGDAITTFFVKAVIQAINRGWLKETPGITKLLLRKHDVMRRYFEARFADFARTYDYNKPIHDTDVSLQKVIWLCWWQGEENAPEITKKCIESVRRNAEDVPVIVVTEENYRQYVDIPEWIIEKYKAGIISRTHYSDILRLYLLSTYGGLWLDATMYCTEPKLSQYLRLPLWTMKRPDYGHLSIAGGRWVTGCMSCDQNHRWIFATVRDFLLHYWEENDQLIDYLVFDYMIDLAICKDDRIAKCFGENEPNNPCGDELLKIMGEPFDESAWRILCEDTVLFILSWKRPFPNEINGRETFYGRLMKGNL